MTYPVGAAELLNVMISEPALYVFPAWVTLVSLELLVRKSTGQIDLPAHTRAARQASNATSDSGIRNRSRAGNRFHALLGQQRDALCDEVDAKTRKRTAMTAVLCRVANPSARQGPSLPSHRRVSSTPLSPRS